MPNFKDFFTKEQFDLFVQNNIDLQNGVIDGGENAARYLQLLDIHFKPALSNYLIAMREEEKLTTTEGFERLGLRLLTAWNRFVKNEPKPRNVYGLDDLDLIADRLSGIAFMILIKIRLHADKPGVLMDELVNQSYQGLVEKIDSGSLLPIDISEFDTCSETGQYIRYEFNNWQINPGLFKNGGLQPPIIPDPPCAIINSITLKTGHLLIADWFRIEEFTEAVEDTTYRSIGDILGMNLAQKRFADEFNFFSVHVGNTLPTIYERDGLFVFGKIDDETDEGQVLLKQYKGLGNVCTDLWNVTIIEKETLIDIVAEKVGIEMAVRQVNDYLRVNDVIELHLAPGVYYSYSYGDGHYFGKYIADYETPGDMITEPFFVMTNKPLELKSKLVATQSSTG